MPEINKTRILIVDDEPYICSIVDEALTGEKYIVDSFSDPVEAFEHIENNHVDLVLTDLVMGEHTGLQILEAAKKNHDDVIVLLMTAYPTVQTAISVLKQGAYDFLVKPFKLELLRATIRRGLAHQKILRDNLSLRGQIEFLKVANAATLDIDIHEYLRMVLNSCRTEISAEVASILCYDPDSKEISCEICEPEESIWCREVVDHATLEQFIGRKRTKPQISKTDITIDGEKLIKVLITKPIVVGSKCHGVINLLVHSKFDRLYPGKLDVLTILANSAASAIVNNRLYQQRRDSYLQAIRALANAIDARDPYTAGHNDRVLRLARQVAIDLGWNEQQLIDLEMGCTLHDIGKIGVPDSILNKPDKLSKEELERMLEHPKVGVKIIEDIALFKPSIPYIISHHERYDGKGYPEGLKGEDIPIQGRLLSVVDTFDAIMSDRPYRDGAPLKVAVTELVENSGTQFDPDIVEIFMRLLRDGSVDLREIYKREEDLSCLEGSESTQKVSVSTTPA